jgi:REP element-mobilizing transposase RayT
VPRPLRIEFPGAMHHVTSRGDRRELIYRDDTDRITHLAVLDQALERFDTEVLSYCLMGNHFHLVLHTRQANLSRLMRQLNGVYTQRLNQRHGLVGHLFQGRFKAILVDRDAYLLALCRYFERNPVAAGLVASAAAWPWSSCRAHVGQAPTPPWLDTDGLHGYLLGRPVASPADRREARTTYARMLEEVSDANLWQSGLRQQVFLGDEAFVGRTLDRLQSVGGRTPKTDGVPKRQTRRPASLDRLLTEAEDRDKAVLEANRDAGFTITEIARHLGLSVSRVSRLIAREEARDKT